MMPWSLPAADTYFGPMLEKDPRGFEIDHLETALAHCKSFRAAVDGGAHVGTWSVAMAKRFERVMAFEPAPDTFACLVQNTAGLPNVECIMSALGPTRSKGKVIDDATREGNTGARHLKVGAGGDTEIVPLDSYMLSDLDFLKLDVEGYEFPALAGAIATILRCKPVMLIECKRFRPPRYNTGPEVACDFLDRAGYREVTRTRNDAVFVHAG